MAAAALAVAPVPQAPGLPRAPLPAPPRSDMVPVLSWINSVFTRSGWKRGYISKGGTDRSSLRSSMEIASTPWGLPLIPHKSVRPRCRLGKLRVSLASPMSRSNVLRRAGRFLLRRKLDGLDRPECSLSGFSCRNGPVVKSILPTQRTPLPHITRGAVHIVHIHAAVCRLRQTDPNPDRLSRCRKCRSLTNRAGGPGQPPSPSNSSHKRNHPIPCIL